jgi:hypothetical protein
MRAHAQEKEADRHRPVEDRHRLPLGIARYPRQDLHWCAGKNLLLCGEIEAQQGRQMVGLVGA